MANGGLLVKNAKRLLPDGSAEECNILADEGGFIAYVGKEVPASGGEVLDAKGCLVVPGLVDAHVHLRDWAEAHKEDLESGTKAALAGGFTTVAEMPNTNPPITRAGLLRRRLEEISRRAYCQVGVWSCPASPGEAEELVREGSLGFKVYLHRALQDASYRDEGALAPLLRQAARLGVPVVIHAELASLIAPLGEGYGAREHARAHPPKAEEEAVRRVLLLAQGLDVRLHFAHVSLARTLRLLREARARGQRVSCEVTPHHLLLSASELARLGRMGIVEPPLRSAGDAAALRRALAGGRIELVASDHAPHAPDEKASPRPPPGFPGLEAVVPVLFTLAKKGELGLARLVEALTRAPCALLGLKDRGDIAPGLKCDLTLIDLRAEGVIDPSRFFSKAKYSPFEGFRYQASVYATIIRGRLAYMQGEVLERKGDVVRRQGPAA